MDITGPSTWLNVIDRATITLHNPYMDFNDPERASTKRCIKAAQAILSAYFMLSATSLDLTRLHPFVTVWVVFLPRASTPDVRRFVGTSLPSSKFRLVGISLRLVIMSKRRRLGERLTYSGALIAL